MAGQSASFLIRRSSELEVRKSNWNTRAQVAAKYCLPHKANITEKQEEGHGVDIDVYDSTAIDASQIAAAGLQAFLCSPASRWFEAKFGDKDADLNDNGEASDWLQEEVEGTYDTLNNSNWNQQIGEFFHDFVVLPGATIFSDSDPIDIVRFMNLPFGEVRIGVNSRGEVDELHREYPMTVKQMVDRWGDKAGSEILEMFKKNQLDEKITILFAVGPRYERNVAKRDSYNLPFYACYVDVKHKRKIEEKGFNEFPFAVGRWRVNSGEDWGYSPAMVALPDILMLNEMQKTIIQAGQMVTSPPWLFPDENFVLPLNFNPNAINYRIPNVTANSGSEKDPFPLISKANLPVGMEMSLELSNRIRKYFFTDLFLPLLEKQATAFEVAKVIEKRMTILGAVVGGITKYVLEPKIQRTMRIRRRHPALTKSLKPIPQIIRQRGGADVKINYISPLAIAQKSVLMQTLETYLFSIGQMAQVNPEVLRKVKWDKAADKIAEIQSIDKDILASDTEYEEAVNADRQAAAEARAMQMTMMGAKAMKDGGAGMSSMMPKGEGKTGK